MHPWVLNSIFQAAHLSRSVAIALFFLHADYDFEGRFEFYNKACAVEDVVKLARIDEANQQSVS